MKPKVFTLDRPAEEELFSPMEVYHENSKLGPGCEELFQRIASVNTSPHIRNVISRPFRSYPGCPVFDLPSPWGIVTRSLEDVLQQRRSNHRFAGTPNRLQELATVLALGDGIVARQKGDDGAEFQLRTGSAVWLAGRGHVRIPDAADLRSITALTLAAWVRFEQLTPNGLPVIIRPSSVAGIPAYGLEIGSQGPRLRLASLAGSRSDGPVTNLTAGAWHHLAATWDGSVVRFYLGGEPVWADRVNAAFGALDLPPGPDLLLGHDGRTRFFEGALDDVLLAGRALSEAEIRELANPPAAEPWAVNVELVPAGAAGAGMRLRFGWPLAGAGEVVLEASEGLGEGWAPASAEVRELGGRRFLEVPVEAGVRARFFRLRR